MDGDRPLHQPDLCTAIAGALFGIRDQLVQVSLLLNEALFELDGEQHKEASAYLNGLISRIER